MIMDFDSVNMEPQFLPPSIVRTFALHLLFAFGMFVSYLGALLVTPSEDPSHQAYQVLSVMLHAPVLLYVHGPVLMAAQVARAAVTDWGAMPAGILWEMAVNLVLLVVCTVHLYCAHSFPWPKPLRPAYTQSAHQRYQAQLQAYQSGGKPPSIEDFPDGVATHYLLLGCAAYTLVCCLFMPHRAMYAMIVLAGGLSCSHLVTI